MDSNSEKNRYISPYSNAGEYLAALFPGLVNETHENHRNLRIVFGESRLIEIHGSDADQKQPNVVLAPSDPRYKLVRDVLNSPISMERELPSLPIERSSEILTPLKPEPMHDPSAIDGLTRAFITRENREQAYNKFCKTFDVASCDELGLDPEARYGTHRHDLAKLASAVEAISFPLSKDIRVFRDLTHALGTATKHRATSKALNTAVLQFYALRSEGTQKQLLEAIKENQTQKEEEFRHSHGEDHPFLQYKQAGSAQKNSTLPGATGDSYNPFVIDGLTSAIAAAARAKRNGELDTQQRRATDDAFHAFDKTYMLISPRSDDAANYGMRQHDLAKLRLAAEKAPSYFFAEYSIAAGVHSCRSDARRT